jgi:capsular polysaccharide biosynthesis protein
LNLTEYIRLITKRGWILVALALIIGGTAFLISRQQTPIYRATQKVVIEPSRADLGLTESSRGLINQLAVIINSQQVAARIIEQLQLDITPGELMSNVTIAPDQLRLTIQIDVDNPHPGTAQDIARAWGQYLSDYRAERNQSSLREDRIFATMPDLPSVGQHAPRPLFNGIAGALLGLIIGGVIVFVLEYLESAMIRRREDVERITDVKVVAVIPPFDN